MMRDTHLILVSTKMQYKEIYNNSDGLHEFAKGILDLELFIREGGEEEPTRRRLTQVPVVRY